MCLPPSSWSLPSCRSDGHVPRHQGLGLRSTDRRIVGTPSPLATHGTRAVAAPPPSLCAASRKGPLVPCAVLSTRRSSPAPHLCHSSTRACVACGSHLAPLGRTLALVLRSALSTICVRSSLYHDTDFSPVELLALPVWLVSCLTPCLGSIHAPSTPPLLLCAPHFLSAAAAPPTIVLFPPCGPYGQPAPIVRGCLRLAPTPTSPRFWLPRPGTALCTPFPRASLALVTFPRVLPYVPPFHHALF